MGSRLWLLERSTLDDLDIPATARGYAREALDGQAGRIGAPVAISARRSAVNGLTLIADAGAASVSVPVIA